MYVRFITSIVALASTLTVALAGSAQAGISWQCSNGAPSSSFEANDSCALQCYSQTCGNVSLTCYDSCVDRAAQGTAADSPDCACMVEGGQWDPAFKVCRFETRSALLTSGGDETAQERNDFGQSTNTQLGFGSGQQNMTFYSVTLNYY